MRILVLGVEGYLGWPLAHHLMGQGHVVVGLDSGIKRVWMGDTGAKPLFGEHTVAEVDGFYLSDLVTFPPDLSGIDAVIHLAEQPSAPFSMRTGHDGYDTVRNNVLSTLNLIYAARERDVHVIKLGTLGEYGTPNADIPGDGMLTWFTEPTKGPRNYPGARPMLEERFPFPKRPGSLYHTSKVMDSELLMFASRVWGLAVTDLHQGVVYGVRTPLSRFYYDAVWGMALNRFLVQGAIGHPLTVYGAGTQRRGFIHIDDVMTCIDIALANPPAPGNYVVRNQFAEVFSIQELAELVRFAANGAPEIAHLDNPRDELQNHYYNPSNAALVELGYHPKTLAGDELERLLGIVNAHASSVNESQILPTVNWRAQP